eukprot:6079984-Pyramimonas_sp.AAC.1
MELRWEIACCCTCAVPTLCVERQSESFASFSTPSLAPCSSVWVRPMRAAVCARMIANFRASEHACAS